MKRIVILSSLALILLFSFVRLSTFLNEKNEFSGGGLIKMPINSAQRGIVQLNKWKEFFPGNSLDDSTFQIENTIFKFKRKMVTGLEFESYEINNPSIKWICDINAIEIGDSTFISFFLAVPKSEKKIWSNLSNYFKSKNQELYYENICKAASSYFESMEHVYDFKFNETNVKYSILLSTNMTSTDTPSVKTIYELIDKLRKVLKEKGENPLDSPMLNTTRIETNLISTTVAIPIQHQFAVSGIISMKNMVLGRILEAPVNGGVNEIKKAFDAMEYYKMDRQKMSPAMPFETLLNYRLTLPDSLWKTKISLPIY